MKSLNKKREIKIILVALVLSFLLVGCGQGSNSNSGNTETTENIAKGVSENLKHNLGEYEKFVDEYIAFMKKYTTGGANIGALYTDYIEIMRKMVDYQTSLKNYDVENMSDADREYYNAVVKRTSDKMLDQLGEMGKMIPGLS